MTDWRSVLERRSDVVWVIPRSAREGMRTQGRVYASEEMMGHIIHDNALDQVANVATLPGIEGDSLAMPDIHFGYGFPIGGVAATREEDGVVSPGGVGYDINCGVRLLRTDLDAEELKPRVRELVDTMFVNVPSGLGSKGKLRLDDRALEEVMVEGASWAVREGFGWADDLDHMEEGGAMPGAAPEHVSEKARKRGRPQLGTLGAGNHFLEVQRVDRIYEPDVAAAFGIQREGQVTVMIHTGSRGFGHQICSDHLRVMEEAVRRYEIKLPDRQLACVPIGSPEGEGYLGGMAAAANYAWTNRQMIMHWVRESFSKVLGDPPEDLGMELVYDVAHNIAKREEHLVDGKQTRLLVHRKGATRAFPAGRPEVPADYADVGQPVIIPGDMGSASYLLVGTQRALEETWGSTCHGAGRRMSRTKSVKTFRAERIIKELGKRGIYVRGESMKVLAEEAPDAYKDVDEVVEVTHASGISRKVARLVPMGVMKG
jgi:tRNA-splicing ligase RtcB